LITITDWTRSVSATRRDFPLAKLSAQQLQRILAKKLGSKQI